MEIYSLHAELETLYILDGTLNDVHYFTPLRQTSSFGRSQEKIQAIHRILSCHSFEHIGENEV